MSQYHQLKGEVKEPMEAVQFVFLLISLSNSLTRAGPAVLDEDSKTTKCYFSAVRQVQVSNKLLDIKKHKSAHRTCLPSFPNSSSPSVAW